MGSFTDILKKTLIPSIAGGLVGKLPLAKVFGQQTGSQLQNALSQSMQQKYGAFPGAGPVGQVGFFASAAQAAPAVGYAEPPALPHIRASGMTRIASYAGGSELWRNKTAQPLRVAGNSRTEGILVEIGGGVQINADGSVRTMGNATTFANIGYVVPTRLQAATVYQAPPPPPALYGGAPQPSYRDFIGASSPEVDRVAQMGRDIVQEQRTKAGATNAGPAFLILLALLLFGFGGR